MGSPCRKHGRYDECMQILVGKPEEEKPLARSKWEDSY
jgi:hypothetical protein